MPMETDSFSPPKVQVGDSVYWYHDPLNCTEPTLGWIVERPGMFTVSVLTFNPNTGFLERPSQIASLTEQVALARKHNGGTQNR